MNLYVVGAIVLAFLGIGGFGAFEYEAHKASVAELAVAEQNLQSVSNALKQSEADKADLARKATELDAAIKERDARLKALNDTKRKLADELDRLKTSVPAEDKACLDRPIPGGILDLLRDGPADSHQDGAGASPGKPVPAVQ